jgi:hypothetical protein
MRLFPVYDLMSEGADYETASWGGHDFSTARKAYDIHAGRSYSEAVQKGTKATDLIPRLISSDCARPLIVACDVTGSMGQKPAEIFRKIPYLAHESKFYLGQDTQIAWAAIGDAFCDKFPLQVRPFAQDQQLAEELKELKIEGGGGGNAGESYELAAYYFLNNTKFVEGAKPVLIFIADEPLFDHLNSAHARDFTYETIRQDVDTGAIFQKLQKMFSVYLIEMSGGRSDVRRTWSKVLSAERIAPLTDAERVNDVIFGILAREVDRVDEFKKEIEERQRPDQVRTVYESLKTVHRAAAKVVADADGRSTMHGASSGGTKSRSLLKK